MKLQIIALATAATMALTGCSGFNNDPEPTDITLTFNFETGGDDFDNNGMWNDALSSTYQTLYIPSAYGFQLAFTHSAVDPSAQTPGSWMGFCPTRGANKNNLGLTTGWNVNNIWSSISGNGYQGSLEYLIGHFDPKESLTVVPDLPSCAFGFGVKNAIPLRLYVNNAAYTYYVMKDGDAEHAAFGPDDYLKLVFKAIKNGAVQSEVDFYLARGTEIVSTWTPVELSVLGASDKVLVQLESNRVDAEGNIDLPTYFCLDDVTVTYKDVVL